MSSKESMLQSVRHHLGGWTNFHVQMGHLNRDYMFNFRFPNLGLWMLGVYVTYNVYRSCTSIKNRFTTWLRSFFNGNQFLNNVAEKYPDELKQVSQEQQRN